MIRGWRLALAGAFGLGLIAGCQTYHPETGLTLPTGYYLQHQPQYFPPTPPYPLPRESAALEEATARQIQVMPPGGAIFP